MFFLINNFILVTLVLMFRFGIINLNINISINSAFQLSILFIKCIHIRVLHLIIIFFSVQCAEDAFDIEILTEQLGLHFLVGRYRHLYITNS